MSYKDATAYAASLAATLMVSIIVFRAGDGSCAACPAEDIEGDDVAILAEIDPWDLIRP